MQSFFGHLKKINRNQSKHDQLINGITEAIMHKEIRNGQSLPTITTFMKELSMSRMTVIKALDELKERGIIESKPRIGYFLKSENVTQQLKVMLFLTAFNPYQEALYNAFLDECSNREIAVDLFFHHGNPRVLYSILNDNLDKYGLYIITPLEDKKVNRLLKQVPGDKLLQITRPVCDRGLGSYVCQDFYSQVIEALGTITHKIKKYARFNLIFPSKCYHPIEIKKAFLTFCNKHNINCAINDRPQIGHNSYKTAYFIIDDGHLIKAIKDAEAYGFQVGKDIGILSYNDTPMKEIIRQGITVISTDFERMGRLAAQFALKKQPVKKILKTNIILRNSL